jgi:lysophospholipase L1-like esterase
MRLNHVWSGKTNMITWNTMKLGILALISLVATVAFAQTQPSNEPGRSGSAEGGALAGHRYRVLVSTDIGGTDPDDFQSMVHLLVYADVLDIEGIISSPFGLGREDHILQVIDCYAKDYANLRTYSDQYPTPDALRAITKQGETERAPYAGVRRSTEGSQWIVECARRDDPRPLHVLIWGGIEDLAQALHDAPDILPRLRVYWIGGPNKKWAPDAYQYLVDHHPELWIIESNATYRGWFTGGNQSGRWGNRAFVSQHIAGKGALGDFFVSKKDEIKMGDTPSLGRLLKGNPHDPAQPGWGGTYVRAWERPHIRFEGMTTTADRMEVFGVLELVLPMGHDMPEQPEAVLVVENQRLAGHAPGDGTMRFRFCPKAAKRYGFTIESNVPALDGKTGGITAYLPSPEIAQHLSATFPNWWTDDPSPEVAEGSHHGAKTVSQWREEFLGDFAQRMFRCQSPAAPLGVETTGTDAPVIFMVGDSTMSDKPLFPAQPERGWGQVLPLYFKDDARVRNLARNGRSSKSFRAEGRWETVMKALRPGDFVIIQFGHNDQKVHDPGRYTEAFGSYKENLARYVREARSIGGNPILATPVVRRRFADEGQLQDTHGDYTVAVRQVAKELHVPLLDIEQQSAELVRKLGPELSKKLYLWIDPVEFDTVKNGRQDDTHLNAFGASRICDIAVQDIRSAVPELAHWLR